MTGVNQTGGSGKSGEPGRAAPDEEFPMDPALAAQVREAAAAPLVTPPGLAARSVARLRLIRGQSAGTIVLSDNAGPGRTEVAAHVVAVIAQSAVASVAGLRCLGGRVGPEGIRVDISLEYGSRGDLVIAAARHSADLALTDNLGAGLPEITINVIDVHTS